MRIPIINRAEPLQHDISEISLAKENVDLWDVLVSAPEEPLFTQLHSTVPNIANIPTRLKAKADVTTSTPTWHTRGRT